MNKFRTLQLMDIETSGSFPAEASDLTVGFRGDVEPNLFPLNAASSLSDVRFEGSGFRKDFGWRSLGAAASSRILSLIEHKFIGEDAQFQRVFRLTRTTAGKARLEALVNGAWILDTTSGEDLRDVLVSAISIQGYLLFADGERILVRVEDASVTPRSVSFPTNELGLGEEVSVAIPHGLITEDLFSFLFNLEVGLSEGSNVRTEVAFLHKGKEVSSRTYSGVGIRTGEEVEVEQKIVQGDTLGIRVKRLLLDPVKRSQSFSPSGGSSPYYTAPSVSGAWGGTFTAEYTFSQGGPPTNFTLFFMRGGEIIREVEHNTSVPGTFSLAIPAGALTGAFEIHFLGIAATVVDFSAELLWGEGAGSVKVVARTITYKSDSGDAGVFELLSPEAPKARYLGSFANRVIALHDGIDSQSLSWCASGEVRNWDGIDSGQLYLLDTRNDPLDELMAFSPLGSNYGALFRKRSIMRVFETGNVTQAIGVSHWIEGLGTEAPFSIQIVPGGLIFLGHDRMVYFLSEGGTVPLGQPIKSELIRSVPSRYELVDSAFDPIFQEYWLGVPENGASTITAAWILELGKFVETREIVWRKRALSASRFATVSKV